MFPDDATAERWFKTQRWGVNREDLHCPRCGGNRIRSVPFGKPTPCWCSDCRRNFSVRIGSVMECSKIGYQKWAIAIQNCLFRNETAPSPKVGLFGSGDRLRKRHLSISA